MKAIFEIKGEETTPPVTLKFFLKKRNRSDEPTICLMATDSEGCSWYIAELEADGRLYLHCSIPSNIGLSVNHSGQIEIKPN
jgi:hypothetical protein